MGALSESLEPPIYDSDDCWKEIREETGFTTYADYLDSSSSTFQQHHKLRNYLKSFAQADVRWSGYCVVLDVYLDGSLSKVVAAENDDRGLPSILETIRSPPSQSLARIVLFDPCVHRSQTVHPRSIDILGLGLRLRPELFEAYLARRYQAKDFSLKLPLDSKFGAIGRAVFTVADDYLPNSSPCPPVLVIMDDFIFHSEAWSLARLLPFEEQFSIDQMSRDKYAGYTHLFETLLEIHRPQSPNPSLDLGEVVVLALIPLLRSQLSDLKKMFDYGIDRYAENKAWKNIEGVDAEREVEGLRFGIRARARIVQQRANDFKRYLWSRNIHRLGENAAYIAVIEEAATCLQDAHDFEAELRDLLQLKVGSLSLEESRKSIQLSNLQIKESKRSKSLKPLTIYIKADRGIMR